MYRKYLNIVKKFKIRLKKIKHNLKNLKDVKKSKKLKICTKQNKFYFISLRVKKHVELTKGYDIIY